MPNVNKNSNKAKNEYQNNLISLCDDENCYNCFKNGQCSNQLKSSQVNKCNDELSSPHKFEPHKFANQDNKTLIIGNDTFNTLISSESEIFAELKHLDLNVHRDVENWKRSIVIDWIMDVCSE